MLLFELLLSAETSLSFYLDFVESSIPQWVETLFFHSVAEKRGFLFLFEFYSFSSWVVDFEQVHKLTVNTGSTTLTLCTTVGTKLCQANEKIQSN